MLFIFLLNVDWLLCGNIFGQYVFQKKKKKIRHSLKFNIKIPEGPLKTVEFLNNDWFVAHSDKWHQATQQTHSYKSVQFSCKFIHKSTRIPNNKNKIVSNGPKKNLHINWWLFCKWFLWVILFGRNRNQTTHYQQSFVISHTNERILNWLSIKNVHCQIFEQNITH